MSNDTQGCYDDADEYGYKIGKLDAVASLSNPVGSCSAIGDTTDTATQREIDSCHQGYDYAYNHFSGINGRPHSEYRCNDHTHTLAYTIGYNNAVQDNIILKHSLHTVATPFLNVTKQAMGTGSKFISSVALILEVVKKYIEEQKTV